MSDKIWAHSGDSHFLEPAEWLVSEIQGAAPDRLVPAALMPMLDVGDAVAELEHAAEIGLHLVSIPTGNPPGTRDYNTYGHTQKTLHELFDDVAPEERHRITRGAFEELFPHVSAPPA